MKACPTCSRVFGKDAGFCPHDGTALLDASTVPVHTASDARLGKLLAARYELRRVVADGGMGRVYEAIDTQEEARVAVKVLHDAVAKDSVALERFKREYEVSSLLPHDYIVKVLDFQKDEVHGVYLLVMEFLEGEELALVLKREGKLEPARVVRLLSQTAFALDEAHRRQFIHRDLKPDNLFLTGTREGDIVKILDFGSVKDKNQQSKKLTVLGTTIGSPYYMAPEQAQGLESLDGRADIFALAAISYEALCGKVPFEGNNGPTILVAIMTKDPRPLSERAPEIPVAVDLAIEEALAKNPNIRTRTVAELATALGKAFGLKGSYEEWATTPQDDLALQISEAAEHQGISKVEDPFAEQKPSLSSQEKEKEEGELTSSEGATQVSEVSSSFQKAAPAKTLQSASSASFSSNREEMERAFNAMREDELMATGIPQKAASKGTLFVVLLIALLLVIGVLYVAFR